MSLKTAGSKIAAINRVREIQAAQRKMESLIVELLSHPDATIEQIGEARSALLNVRQKWAEIEPLLARSAVGRYVKDVAVRTIANARGSAR